MKPKTVKKKPELGYKAKLTCAEEGCSEETLHESRI